VIGWRSCRLNAVAVDLCRHKALRMKATFKVGFSVSAKTPSSPLARVPRVCSVSHFHAGFRLKTYQSCSPSEDGTSDSNSFDFIERKLLSRSVIELSGPGRFVVRDGLGVLERPAILQIRRDTGSPEGVATGGIGEGGGLRPPLDHLEDVKPRHGLVRELVPLVHTAEETPLVVADNARRLDVGVQVAHKTRMAGYLMTLAALLMEPEP